MWNEIVGLGRWPLTDSYTNCNAENFLKNLGNIGFSRRTLSTYSIGGRAWLLGYGPGNRGITVRLQCAQADYRTHSASCTGSFPLGVKWRRKSWPLTSIQQRYWKWEDLYIHIFKCLLDVHRYFAFLCVQTLHQISVHLLHYNAFRLQCDNELALESKSYTHPTHSCENLIISVTVCDMSRIMRLITAQKQVVFTCQLWLCASRRAHLGVDGNYAPTHTFCHVQKVTVFWNVTPYSLVETHGLSE
jgi:hypothetical protein